MCRVMVLVIALAVGLFGGGGAVNQAFAAPTPKTTVKLTCDRGVGTATVTVTLQPSLFDSTVLGTANLSCGPDSTSGQRSEMVVVVTSQPAGWANISSFFVTTAAGSGGCPGGSALPVKAVCPNDGSSTVATLVVR